MAMAFFSGQMGRNTVDDEKKIKQTAREISIILMGISIQAILQMIKPMDMEPLRILMVQSIKDTERMIYRMALEKKNGQMGIFILVTMSMEKRKAKESINDKMAMFMKAIEKIIKLVDRVCIYGGMAGNTKANGKTIRCMVREFINGRMEGVTKEYVSDKKHGFGKYYWADGKIYEGFWVHGKQHGKGPLLQNIIRKIGIFIKNGEKKVGIWENGIRVKWLNDLVNQL